VPSRVFDPDALADVALHEQHLLTAILTVSAKDLNEEGIYMACSGHMQKLISALVIGMKCEVEAVEALLILAEWTPHQQNAVTGSIGRGEEDRAAWMYVGMALRAGYYQGLDATSFRNAGEPRDEQFLRHRLVWTGKYQSVLRTKFLILTYKIKLVTCQIVKYRYASVEHFGHVDQGL